MSLSRRDFLHSSAGLALAGIANAAASDTRVIFLTLLGGPSQLDTWDPKPDAPSEVRGPFATIPTRVPALRFTELFPRLAALADRFAVVRSMYHNAPPIHETGLQLLQTGGLGTPDAERPSLSALASAKYGSASVLLPGPIGFTGVNIGHGQSAGSLGQDHEPKTVEFDVTADRSRERFGRTPFGDDCLRAARLVERGTRFVTVNMFQSVYDTITWDCHSAGGSLRSELTHYRQIGPMFDAAFAGLIEELGERGLLSSTLVVATGEFGRTPYLNRQGGRDHWAGAWTALLAGAGVSGGQIIGRTDRIGGEPTAEPIAAEELASQIRHAIGV